MSNVMLLELLSLFLIGTRTHSSVGTFVHLCAVTMNISCEKGLKKHTPNTRRTVGIQTNENETFSRFLCLIYVEVAHSHITNSKKRFLQSNLRQERSDRKAQTTMPELIIVTDDTTTKNAKLSIVCHFSHFNNYHFEHFLHNFCRILKGFVRTTQSHAYLCWM